MTVHLQLVAEIVDAFERGDVETAWEHHAAADMQFKAAMIKGCGRRSTGSERLGATRLPPPVPWSYPDVCADPSGHPFCLGFPGQ